MPEARVSTPRGRTHGGMAQRLEQLSHKQHVDVFDSHSRHQQNDESSLADSLPGRLTGRPPDSESGWWWFESIPGNQLHNVCA